jgi:hypothetical protein
VSHGIVGPIEWKEISVPQYMVERHLPDFPPEQLPGAAAAAKEKSAELSGEGDDVSYVRSTFSTRLDKATR